MCKRIASRLRSRKGESLVEVLVAITIGLFAMLMLTTVISVSTKLDKDSREIMGAYYQANNELAGQFSGKALPEGQEATMEKKNGTVSLSDGTRTEIDVRVEYYTNGTVGREPVVAYRSK